MRIRSSARRMAPFALALAVVWSSLGATPALAAPFSNGGFESGQLSPWIQNHYVADGMNWNVTGSAAHGGAFSVTSSGSKELLQSFDGISTRTISRLTFYARHDSPVGGDLGITFLYGDQTQSHLTVPAGVSPDWVLFDVTSLLLPRKLLVAFGISGLSSGCPTSCAQVWIDDVVITQIPEPRMLPLLGLGFAGLAGCRRRPRASGGSVPACRAERMA